MMSRRGLAAGVAVVLAVGIVVAVWRGITPTTMLPQAGGVSPFELLEALEDDDFVRIPVTWDFRFPADHGRHSEYRTEWWYLSGVLTDESLRRLGVQLAVVRLGLAAQPSGRRSRWATSEIYAGLFSVSDPAGGKLRTFRRTSRAALGLAGTASKPTRLWVEDWWLERGGSSDNETQSLAVHIGADGLELDLELLSMQPLLNSDQIREQGFDETAPFHLYIQPRLGAKGTLQAAGQPVRVTGTLSLEHAWGELPLPGGAVARDRFTLHLDDGRELLCVRTHRVDGSGTPTTTGLWIDTDDQAVVLTSAQIELKPTAYWESARTHVQYPTQWVLRVPDKDIELALIPYHENQEGVLWASFWAGPVKLRAISGETVGDGFVQLNGYEGT